MARPGILRALHVLAAVILFPLALHAQGTEARKAFTRLLPSSGDATFAAAVSKEAAGLVSIDDAAWLAGALAAEAKNAGQRKALLVERASLLEVLGRYADAATAWESAAGAVPGIADPVCLLSAAVCRLAAGDGEAAAGLATAVSFASPAPLTASLASLVSGWAALSRGERSVAAGLARTAAADSDPRVAVAALMLAVASTDGAERADFEKRLAAHRSRPEAVSTVPLLLLAGSTIAGARVQEAPATGSVQAPPASDAAAEMSYYQIGAFRDEANARALVKKLEAMGTRPLVRHKESRGLFVVYVEAGDDAARTVLVLKDAGYEAWAIEGAP